MDHRKRKGTPKKQILRKSGTVQWIYPIKKAGGTDHQKVYDLPYNLRKRGYPMIEPAM